VFPADGSWFPSFWPMNRSAGSRRPPGLITVRFSGRSCPSPAASPPEMPATRQTQSVLENFRGGVLSRAVVADRNPPGIGFRLPAGTGSGPLNFRYTLPALDRRIDPAE